MLVESVSNERWQDAQAFELDYWKHYINDPAVEYRQWEKYFDNLFSYVWEADYTNKTICEIGMGPLGVLWKFVNAAKRIGVEPLAHKFLELKPDLYKDVDVVISTGGESLPTIADESCDVVISINVLDHAQDAEACLNEMYRILKKNGSLILACDLKSKPEHSDRGHPIVLSKEWFDKWIASKEWSSTERVQVVKSRSVDAAGNDKLDGTIAIDLLK